QRMGLAAGWGDYPLAVARALKRLGFEVYCLGIKDHADPRLGDICDDFRFIGIAKLGGQIRYFKRQGVRQATMAGKLFKAKLLFQRWGWLRHFPDWRCCRTFYPHFLTHTKDRKDDTLLTDLANAYAQDGIVFAPATDFAPELLVKLGPLTDRKPTAAQQKDIAFGWRLAKELGRVDVGQTVAVKGRAALAVEAVEGTDECIRRAGQLCPQGGFTVVKVAKPRQDMRFDVPTIGLGTVRALQEAGGQVLAVEAGKTIIVDEEEVVRFAARHRLTLVAVDPREFEEEPKAS
ncbi:MAG: LpxI family protein, partial [Planctomycetes bacterium]|nr:LpxI family protein [Planctomycetota bacterium]